MTRPRGIPDGFVERPTRGPFARLVGPYYEAAARGDEAAETVVRGFQVEERHTNALGIAHGGMLMAFLDSVLAGAVATVAEGSFVTLRMTTDFLAPARRGDWVEGHAVVTRQTRSVCFVRGELRVEPSLGRALIEDALLRFLVRADYKLEPGGDYNFTVRARF